MSKAARSKQKIKTSDDDVFADFRLAVRLETATVAMLSAYQKTIRRYRPKDDVVALEDVCGGKMLFAGPGSPLNHAIGMGMRRPVTQEDMDRVEAFYCSRKSPVEIMVCPLVDIAFAQLLVQRGYKPTEFENVLVLSLRKWRSNPASMPKKAQLQVRKNTLDQAELATKVVSDGFHQMSMPAEIRATLEDFQRLPNALCYMAYANGEPVASASGMIAPRQKIALLYGTATLPSHRKLGAQSLLLQARLREAVAAGCELATVSTHPGTTSQRNAERAGFRVAYTKTTYVLE